MKIKIIDMLSKMNSDCNYRPNINFHGNNYTYKKDYDDYMNDTGHLGILSGYSINMILDDEVEILDDPKKIEKIDMCTSGIMGFDGVEHITEALKNKLNEVIDKVNSLDKEDENSEDNNK